MEHSAIWLRGMDYQQKNAREIGSHRDVVLRRMLRISWTEKITNAAVLRRAGTARHLMKNILERQMKFLGHVMKKESLEEVSVTGRIEGTRGRGRPQRDYLHSLCDGAGGTIGPTELLRATKDRIDMAGNS